MTSDREASAPAGAGVPPYEGELEPDVEPPRPHGDELREVMPDDGAGEAVGEDDGGLDPGGAAPEADLNDGGLSEAGHAVESDLVAALAQRDDYLEALRRLQADFENYRKRVLKQQTEHLERAAEGLVEKVLPVLDACESALIQGADSVTPIYTTLLGVLEKEGLVRIDPQDETFDPNLHEAVMHETGEGASGGPVVSEVLRTGYGWKGRVLRPAMVKVQS